MIFCSLSFGLIVCVSLEKMICKTIVFLTKKLFKNNNHQIKKKFNEHYLFFLLLGFMHFSCGCDFLTFHHLFGSNIQPQELIINHLALALLDSWKCFSFTQKGSFGKVFSFFYCSWFSTLAEKLCFYILIMYSLIGSGTKRQQQFGLLKVWLTLANK